MTEEQIVEVLRHILGQEPPENSLIVGRVKSLLDEKQMEKLEPPGRPLKPWGDEPVPISEEDIALAIAEWNERVPEAAGLLEAE